MKARRTVFRVKIGEFWEGMGKGWKRHKHYGGGICIGVDGYKKTTYVGFAQVKWGAGAMESMDYELIKEVLMFHYIETSLLMWEEKFGPAPQGLSVGS